MPRNRNPKNLVSSVLASFEAMPWLTEADEAAKELALRYAKDIEDGYKRSPQEGAKALGWTGNALIGVLRSLGATPDGRKALDIQKPVRGRLAELRALRGGQEAAQ